MAKAPAIAITVVGSQLQLNVIQMRCKKWLFSSLKLLQRSCNATATLLADPEWAVKQLNLVLRGDGKFTSATLVCVFLR